MPTKEQREEVMFDILRWVPDDGVDYDKAINTWKNLYRNEFIKKDLVKISFETLIINEHLKLIDNVIYRTPKGMDIVTGQTKFFNIKEDKKEDLKQVIHNETIIGTKVTQIGNNKNKFNSDKNNTLLQIVIGIIVLIVGTLILKYFNII